MQWLKAVFYSVMLVLVLLIGIPFISVGIPVIVAILSFVLSKGIITLVILVIGYYVYVEVKDTKKEP